MEDALPAADSHMHPSHSFCWCVVARCNVPVIAEAAHRVAFHYGVHRDVSRRRVLRRLTRLGIPFCVYVK